MSCAVVLNGIYPRNPIWQQPWFLIAIFEILVIGIELSFIIGNLDWIKNNKKRAALLIVLANLVTFGLGIIIQLLLGAA